MEIKEIFETCNTEAEGNLFDFLIGIYQALKKESGRESILLQQFVEQYAGKAEVQKDAICQSMSRERLGELLRNNESLVDGYLEHLAYKEMSQDEFYRRVWSFLQNREFFEDDEVSSVAFIWVCRHRLVPYYYYPDRMRMENEVYRDCIRKQDQQRHELRFALEYRFIQKTETASVLWKILHEPESEEEQVVLLSSLLDLVRRYAREEDDE